MKIISTLFALLLIASLSFATGGDSKPSNDNSVLQGKVIDETNGDELTGVKVEIEGTSLVTYTDRYGNFSFDQVPGEKVELHFSFISFEDRKISKDNLSDLSASGKHIALSSK